MSARLWFRAGTVLLAGSVVLVLCLVWQYPPAAPLAQAVGTVRPETPLEPPALVTPLPRIEVTPSEARLRLVVRDHGRLAVGSVAWITGTRPEELVHALATALYPGARDDERAHTAWLDPECVLPVPDGAWCWLRVRGVGGATAFARIAPFHGEQLLELELSGRPAIAHVQVLSADWCTPAADAEVVVEAGDLRGGALHEVARARADSLGYLRLQSLPKGRIVLRTPMAEPTDGPPYTATIAIEDGSFAEPLVLLVQEPQRRAVHVQLLAEGVAQSPVPPKLFFRRIDLEDGAPVPQPGTMIEGVQEWTVRLAPGTYYMDCLPAGEFTITGDTRIDVAQGSDAEASIHATATRERTRVRLVGPGLGHYPMRVSTQPAHGLRDDDPDLMFIGRFHWQAAEQSVPSMTEPCLLLALGRQAGFISTTAMTLRGESCEVQMRPATCLQVQWVKQGDRAGACLVVDDAGQTYVRPFVQRLVPCPAGSRPALVANLVVPSGKVRLEGRCGASGVWYRDVVAKGRCLAVAIED